MYMRTLTSIILLLTLSIVGTAAPGQEASSTPQSVQTPKPPQPAKPKPERAPAATPMPQPEAVEQIPIEPVNIKLVRGGKVALSSRSGRIVVTGWDRDV